jgi:DNA-binding transcriptional ArsR family regulator
MATTTAFAEIAMLAGDPARAAMLQALMDGRALTATELSLAAGVTPQTASGHLARMAQAGLLAVEKQGRHRYHRLADPSVARMIESIMQVASSQLTQRKAVATGPRELALRTARTCYDHLAGRLGVALADALVTAGHAELGSDAGAITPSGVAFLRDLGIDLNPSRGRRRVLCRPCLDWSERRPHLAGLVGAALCAHCRDAGWVRRVEGSRAMAITPKGQLAFRQHFGIDLTAT